MAIGYCFNILSGTMSGLGKQWSDFKGGTGGNMFSGLASGVGNAVGGLINSNGLESGAGNVVGAIGKLGSMIPGPMGAMIGAAGGVLSGAVNAAFGSKLNEENIAKVEENINALNSFTSSASNFDDLSSNWSNATTGMSFSNKFIGKDGWFSSKAADKAKDLREQVRLGTDFVDRSLNNNMNNIQNTQMNNLLAGLFKYGGPLGGYGADYTNGLIQIDEGGTHEQNPLGGVPMGVGPDGIPQLVQQGEAVFNNYVFSNDLFLDKKETKELGLAGKKLSYAQAAKKLAKESEERPNDAISRDTVRENMMNLTMLQEMKKQKLNRHSEKQINKKFKDGGFTLPDWLSQTTQFQKDIDLGLVQPTASYYAESANKPLELPSFTTSMPKAKTLQDTFNSTLQVPDFTGKTLVTPTVTSSPTSDEGNLNTQLRYAGAIGSGVQALTDALGITNKANYSNAERLVAAARNRQFTPVSFTPLSQKMGPTFIDTQAQANALNQQASASRRALMNSGLSKGQLAGSLISADYNTNSLLGKALAEAKIQQQTIDKSILDFNRSTDQYNSEGALKAATQNQTARLQYDNAYMTSLAQAMQLREAERNAVDTAKSTNLANFLNNLQNIGTENFRFNAARTNPAYLYGTSADGSMKYKGNKDK